MKTISSLLILSSVILLACNTSESETTETITIDNYGEEIIYTPSEEDWCGEDCIIYPESGQMYIRASESGDNTFYLEGTDRNLEDASNEADEIIKDYNESNY